MWRWSWCGHLRHIFIPDIKLLRLYTIAIHILLLPQLVEDEKHFIIFKLEFWRGNYSLCMCESSAVFKVLSGWQGLVEGHLFLSAVLSMFILPCLLHGCAPQSLVVCFFFFAFVASDLLSVCSSCLFVWLYVICHLSTDLHSNWL